MILNIPGFSSPIYHSGPPLEDGPLPALFYFSLSGEESLTLDPYNQPVVFLADQRLRIFSLTLPGHGPEFTKQYNITFWQEQISKENDIITEFVVHCRAAIDFLIASGYIEESSIAAAGLSRGAFIAVHLAAIDPRIKTILGYAPLTRFDTIQQFAEISPQDLVQNLALVNLIDRLVDKNLRFYIGNRDIQVSTDACYTFIKTLTEATYQHNHRSPPIELIIYPSIGHKGHGTPPHIFRDGIEWLKRKIKQAAAN